MEKYLLAAREVLLDGAAEQRLIAGRGDLIVVRQARGVHIGRTSHPEGAGLLRHQLGKIRGEDEGVGDAMAAKIRNALALYRTLRAVEGVEFRFHRTVLYNSIYVADDQVLVNTHVYGTPAAQAPVWHLHKLAGGELTSLYLDSFERVWESATPAEGS